MERNDLDSDGDGLLPLPSSFDNKTVFVLDRPEQVTNLTEADPNTEYLLWAGKKDLSARVNVARAAGALKIRVAVTDNLFSQEATPNLSDGDSVQLALLVPAKNGVYQMTLADVKGEAQVRVDGLPAGMDATNFKPALQIERDGSNRTYELTLTDAMLGLTPAQVAGGMRLNVLVNDNDGRGRKGYIALAPVVGGNFDSTRVPLLVPGE